MLTPLLALLPALALQPAGPSATTTTTPPDAALTVAERSGYARTSRHADVVATLDALAAGSPMARRLSLGTSSEGRDIPMLVLADPPVTSAAEARRQVEKDGKLLVLAIGNIHAGEVEGKEALPILAREILGASGGRLLSHMILVIAPIHNADGNEKFSPDHRPHQNGPAEVGIRENGHGRDLNRDYVKLEEPETRALVTFLNDWDPHAFIDCHTTDGSYHRYALTYAGPKNPAGDPALLRYSRDTFFPALALAFEAATTRHAFWYGNFEGAFGDAPRGHTRWESFPPEARYGTTYVGLRSRLSILSEAYVYDPFQDRIQNTKAFVRVALELLAQNRETIIAMEHAADERAVTLGNDTGDANDLVAIRSKPTPAPGKVTILGFDEDVKDGKTIRADRPHDYECELWDTYTPTLSVARPFAYAIPDEPDMAPVIDSLRRHGLRLERLTHDIEADCERSTITTSTPADRPFEGHVIVHAETEVEALRATVPAGAWVVRTGQPLGSLAVYLLEPRSEDGLVAWNYFDDLMVPGARFPIVRVMSPFSPGDPPPAPPVPAPPAPAPK